MFASKRSLSSAVNVSVVTSHLLCIHCLGASNWIPFLSPFPTASNSLRDGVIEGSIDHGDGWLLSNEVVDLYSTEEPQKAFHK
jgi:hypothetical protein